MKIIQGYIRQGWLKSFDSADELAAYVGDTPVYGKFACIVKDRPDGSQKRRIIMDSKQSGATDCTKRHYRAILPRQTDLIADILNLLAEAQAAESVLLFVLDAVGAYWQVPLTQVPFSAYVSTWLPRHSAEGGARQSLG